nr:hemagglutinin repeat-containing protein [Stenotrophomonas indicatrix]
MASLFNVNRNGGNYLVETDPRFTDHKTWLSSDHLLGQMGYSPDTVQKRLGDGYYEQKLVREQIGQLTGRRFLDGYASDEAQYRALLEAGATVASEWGLRPGVALTEAQMAQLTSDIVWLVEKTVTLADGSTTTALVPQVYLRLRPGDLDGQGALLAGANVDIKLANGLVNTGDIAGRKLVTIDAGNIEHLGGSISGQYVGLSSDKDIRIAGATVTATDALSVQAVGNVTVASTVETQRGGGTYQYETNRIDRVAGLYVTNPSGDGMLSVVAGGDISLQAAQIRNAGKDGSTQLAAGGNLDLGAQTLSRSTDSTFDNRNHTRTSQTTHAMTSIEGAGDVVLVAGKDINLAATQVKAGGDMALQAGGDINSHALVDSESRDFAGAGKRSSLQTRQSDETVRGSQLQAGGDIALSAGRDVTLIAASARSDKGTIIIGAERDVNLLGAKESHAWERDAQSKKRGLTSSTRTATHDATQDVLAVGTTLSAEKVTVGSGRDILAEGAKVAATGDVVMAAKGSLSIVAAESTHSEQHSSDRKKSGLLSGMNGSIGVTFGSRSSGNSTSLTETVAEGSLIGSALGSVTLSAGETLHLGGSDVLSRTGTTMLGKDVLIDAAEQQTRYTDNSYFRQSGLNVALGGASVDTVQSARAVYATAKRAGDVEDDRLKALYAYKAAQGAIAVAEAAGQQSGNGEGGAGLNVRVTVGSQRSRSESVMEQTTHRGSLLKSDGDVVVAATGGDLTIVGSQVSGRNVDLAAVNDLIIRSSEDRYSQESRNQSLGGEVGVAISGSSGGGAAIGVYVGANAARGKADGEGTLHNESVIQAGDRLTFTSGGNTTLQGAQLLADQVVGRVAGDLTLRSEQDTDRYKTEQLAAKGEATIGYGFEGSASGSASMIDSDYRSVREQTGIAAGRGGFQLQVGGNTHLAGAVIASTGDPSKNLLSTGSLTVEELKNRAEFLSASVSGGTSGGGNPSDGLSFDPSLAPGLPTGDSKSSTTRSGLAEGTVEIRNGDLSALEGVQRGVTGLDGANGFSPIFDEKKVQERQELTQMLGQIGFLAAGNLAERKRAQASADLEIARANGDAESEADALRRIDQWGEGGRNKVLLHGLTGAAVAALSGGDLSNAATGAAGSELAKGAMIRFLTGQGLNPDSGEFNSLIKIASAALGGVIGGSDGATTALLGDRFNRQLHPDEVVWINTHAAAFAKQEGISEAEAIRRLTVEGAARVDAKINNIVGNENVDAAATAFLSTMGGKYGFGATEAEYNNFSLYGKELLKDDSLYRQVFNSLLGSGVHRDDLNLPYFGLNSLRATMVRGRDGQMMLENFSGDVGAAGSLIASVSRGDGNGAAITAATFLIPIRMPGAKIVGEVGVEIAGSATREAGRRSNEILKSVETATADTVLKRGGAASEVPARSLDQLLPDGKVPSVRNGEFNRWFDELSSKELEVLWENKRTRDAIEARIRQPGGLHEWCMVCRAPDFKGWGVSMDEIKRFRTKTKDLKWTNPADGKPGGHGGHGSGTFHNELGRIIDESKSLEEFNSGIIILRDRWKIDPALLPPLPKS